MVWTSAQDRNVILWPILEGHVPKEVLGIQEMENPHLCMPTMGGFIYVMNVNPIDSSQMAVGLGDCSIRLWNMAAAKPDMTMLWSGIKGDYNIQLSSSENKITIQSVFQKIIKKCYLIISKYNEV